MADARSPTVRRRELGALLRSMRQEAQLTVQQVADRLLVAPSSISRLETGQRSASPRDIRDLCNLYGIGDPVLREHLNVLAREGRRQAWWQPFDLPYATYVGLEAEAAVISDFEPGVFPGLLQTPDYARAIHQAAVPAISPAVIEQRIEERLTRQQTLAGDSPPELRAVMDEAVLRRVVGGAPVMAAQLQRVCEAAELPQVTIQVIAFDAGAHPALDSTFILLDFDGQIPAVVYVEGLVGQIYLERAEDVQRYTCIFERLCAMALSPQKSLDLMATVRAHYQRD